MWHYNTERKTNPSNNPAVWINELVKLADKHCASRLERVYVSMFEPKGRAGDAPSRAPSGGDAGMASIDEDIPF